MANAKLCCNFTAILIIFLVIPRSSCARPLLNDGLLPSESSHSSLVSPVRNFVRRTHPVTEEIRDPVAVVEANRKVRNEHLNLLLHRLPKGKVPASGPGKRTHSNNN
ncbi:hypothetical protein HAX54_047594 [Datura stramonium]|uniref:Uncharacterized protein n=1 Tax=Datura stramonium TaxID=4076 RepID=A0ABS8SST9_DATST|nr:hypothetical protein [Datura stramonium]